MHEVVAYLSSRGMPLVHELRVVEEDVRFGLPHELIELARKSGKRLVGTVEPAGR